MKRYIAAKAKDLKVGDSFSHWAKMEDGLYPEGFRIESIDKDNGRIMVLLSDDREYELRPEMIVVIQDLA